VPAPNVLHERVTADDHAGGVVAFEAPHRPVGAGNAFGHAISRVGCSFWVFDGGVGASKLMCWWWGWPLSGGSGCLAVLVDESVAAGVSSDRSAGPIFDDVAIVWCALTETAVGSVGVVVRDVLVEEPFELGVVPDEGAVAELAAHRAHPTFRERVRDRRARRGADDRRAVDSEDLVEPGGELAAAVTDQEPDRPQVAHREVPGCLGRPRTGRVLRDAGEVHASRVELDEEQHVVAA
jgi:hypothetical protein